MKSRFTICVYSKRDRRAFVYHVEAGTAEAAVQQMYEEIKASRRTDTLTVVAVFQGHHPDCLTWPARGD